MRLAERETSSKSTSRTREHWASGFQVTFWYSEATEVYPGQMPHPPLGSVYYKKGDSAYCKRTPQRVSAKVCITSDIVQFEQSFHFPVPSM